MVLVLSMKMTGETQLRVQFRNWMRSSMLSHQATMMPRLPTSVPARVVQNYWQKPPMSWTGISKCTSLNIWKNVRKVNLIAESTLQLKPVSQRYSDGQKQIHGDRFEGRGEILQILAQTLSRQGKWEEIHILLQEKFDRREETMENLAADCLTSIPPTIFTSNRIL